MNSVEQLVVESFHIRGLSWLIATSLFNSVSLCNSKVICKYSQQNYTFLKILKSIVPYTENGPLEKALFAF